jgi:proteasome lid subunit RPN8/RPN11
MITKFVEKTDSAELQADTGHPGAGLRAENLPALGGFSLHQCFEEKREPGDPNILCSHTVIQEILKHLKKDTSREHGGLLLGYETAFGSNDTPTVLVTHSLPARNTVGSSTHVTFGDASWEDFDEFRRKLDALGLNLQRVGWYHSHPNIPIFLSKYDLDVNKTFDGRKNPIALVIDPVNLRAGFFVRGKVGYRPCAPQGYWEFRLPGESAETWTNMAVPLGGSSPEAPVRDTSAAPASPPEPERAAEEADTDDIEPALRQHRAPAPGHLRFSPAWRWRKDWLVFSGFAILFLTVCAVMSFYLRDLHQRVSTLEQRALAADNKQALSSANKSPSPQQTPAPQPNPATVAPPSSPKKDTKAPPPAKNTAAAPSTPAQK